MKVEIYGAENCPNCKTAENLTIKSGFDYTILKAGNDYQIPDLMSRIGHRVGEFPQVFVDDKYVGGIAAYRDFLKENVKEDEADSDLGGFEL